LTEEAAAAGAKLYPGNADQAPSSLEIGSGAPERRLRK
jgi:hypothetical protein